ncbi:hypothetical protein EDC01DRAFT_782790 [Geopyxis carbonaria]|nr:hypothetical protein EDC01DRAFT_782790 [Geopyxis carbonaria]
MVCDAFITAPETNSTPLQTKRKIYLDVLIYVRQQALEAAKKSSHNIHNRALACKVSFHLNQYITVESPPNEDHDLRGPWSKFVATIRDGGRHISNQFIAIPGLLGGLLRVSYLPEFDPSWCFAHRIIVLTFAAVTGAFYGGMHAFKWHDPFPSAAERMLWRVSTLIGAAGIIALVVALAVAHRYDIVSRALRGVARPGDKVYWALFGVAGMVFLAARIFLVVESFVSMRALSKEAYKTVPWAEVLPHF